MTDYSLLIEKASRQELLQIVVLAAAKLATPPTEPVPTAPGRERPRENLITAKEAAAIAGVTVYTVCTWSRDNDGNSREWALRTTAGRLHKIKREMFLAWFEARGKGF